MQTHQYDSLFPACPQMQEHKLLGDLPFLPAGEWKTMFKEAPGDKSSNYDFDVVSDIFATFQQLPRRNFSSNYWSLPF